jgi:hypothetical protein
MLNKAYYHSLEELKSIDLEDLLQLEKEVIDFYKETKEAYYYLGITVIDGEEELELYINRIQHVLYGECLDNENR